jgi:predicted ATP-dependent protease
MNQPLELPPDRLRRTCDPSQFRFRSTAEIDPLEEVIGQERAVRAIQFGLEMGSAGYNIFVTGLEGTGKTTIVRELVQRHARTLPKGPDWCLVNNFEDEFRPRIVALPSGRALRFSRQVRRLLEGLRRLLAASQAGEAYRNRQAEIQKGHTRQQRERFERLEQAARARGVGIARDQSGFQVLPLQEGKPMSPEQFEQLSAARRRKLDAAVQQTQGEIEATLREAERGETALRAALEEHARRDAQALIAERFEALRTEYREWDGVLAFLDAAAAEILDNLERFVSSAPQPATAGEGAPPQGPLDRFRVNVLVDRGSGRGAPVIFESNPSHANLFGLIDKRLSMGNVTTDFTMVQAGSLLRANDGFLIMEVETLLMHPPVWEALKRSLQNKRLEIEDPAAGSAWGAAALRPQPIPLAVKVILLGSYEIFFMLQNHDTKFNKIFRVRADFDDAVARSAQTDGQYARFIARVCRAEHLLPFTPRGVAAIVEYGEKQAADQARLSLRFGPILGVLREADFWARRAGARRVSDRHVVKAFREHRFRYNLYEEKTHDAYREGTLLMEVSGAVVGQVNGLAVHHLGDIAFGRPCRITAASFMGRQGVVNIEREARLSGRLHDKGVLILAGFLGATFAQRHPLSLSISLAFEQSYDEIDGDSASSAELYAILSSLSGLPLRQAIAVTGSVNQRGQVQAIGGVNQKVEGFFDVCRLKGLSGRQGVMIPQANVRHLMLKREVVEAVSRGRFHLWAVDTIAQGIGLLTGVEAGEADSRGRFPAGTVNERVARRLEEYWRGMNRRREGASPG